MNDKTDAVIDDWWVTKSQLISKYVLSYYFYIHLVILLPISIIELRFGVVYDENCTIDYRIVLYLLLIGIFQMIYSANGIVLIISCYLYKKYPNLTQFLCIDFLFQEILLVFLFIWFLVGNYLVFHVKNQVQYTNSYITSTYCDYTLYQTAFWMTITYYFLIILFIFVLILTHLKYLVEKLKSSKNKITVQV